MDSPHDRHADQDASRTPSEAELRAMMEQSARDVEAGHIVPLADVLAELDGVADRIEDRRRARRA
jgi:hypothetical protein